MKGVVGVVSPWLSLVGLSAAALAQTTASNDWQTLAEQTDFEQTSRYAAVVSFCRRLADASPWAQYTSFGKSGELRDLPLLIVSKERAFTPQAARASERQLVLIINCIHPGEVMGKDASLMLVRDMLIHKKHAELLEQVNLLVIPIFNTDGHERFGRYNRINQMGPKDMGWRVTARNLNLNRDFLKADAVEMRAWLKLYTTWQPDLFLDNHSTDGADFQYDVLFEACGGPATAGPVAKWVNEEFYPFVATAMQEDGHITGRYLSLRDRADPGKGVTSGWFGPRYSIGYGAITNRPGIIVETHVRKPYAVRVKACYDLTLHTLRLLYRSPRALKSAVRAADEQTAAWGKEYDAELQIPLTLPRSEAGEPFVFRGLEARTYESEVTGSAITTWTGKPVDVETRHYHTLQVDKSVVPPLAYLIPPQWTEAIELALVHGLRVERLTRPVTAEVESYRFSEVRWADRPFEGRLRVSFQVHPIREQRTFLPGSGVIRLNQPRAKVAVHLFEPAGPDSLVSWGFFNAIFEQKEYFEDYVMEPIARQMLKENRELKAEFEAKLKSDPDFAADPGERLAFFYRRSPYWDDRKDVYPIARVTKPIDWPTEPCVHKDQR